MRHRQSLVKISSRYTDFGTANKFRIDCVISQGTTTMAQTATSALEQIHTLLASKGYSVADSGIGGLRILEVDTGVSLQAVLESDILFLSLVCMSVPSAKITPALMHKMLDARNGISTSHFQLFETGDGNVAITLNNFCKLQEMGADDEDDILSCVSFLLADVLHAKDLIGADLQ
jgi:hypothetical protein